MDKNDREAIALGLANPGSLHALLRSSPALLHYRKARRKSAAEVARRVELYGWAQLHGLVMLKADGFIESPLDPLLD